MAAPRLVSSSTIGNNLAKESTFAYKDSTALITGASGGLREAFAEALANKAPTAVLAIVLTLSLRKEGAELNGILPNE